MLERLQVTRKTGDERFTTGGAPLGFNLLEFWQWSGSDLVSNAMRGRLAEFLVARALGIEMATRNEWDAYDLTTASNLRIEVKSAAYLQSWAQARESTLSFDIRETLAWDYDANTFAPESARKRQADLYVFTVLAHRTKATLDPLDVTQWEFHLLAASVLNQRVKNQRSISLNRLRELGAHACSYSALSEQVAEAEARLKGATAGAEPGP